MQDLVGRSIGFGRYQLLSVLGRGGMATVYEAEHKGLHRRVAIKVLDPSLTQRPDFVERFQREAETIAQLEHPHILPVYDTGEEGDLLYLVMFLVRDGTLKNRLRTTEPLPWPPRRVLQLAQQVLPALDSAHSQGIVHRDIKPDNILLHGDRAFLADFGIAKLMQGDPGLTVVGSFVGTPEYAAPEQVLALPLDGRSDLYAFGVVLYELLVGRVPYSADTPMGVALRHVQQRLPSPTEINPLVSAPLSRVLVTALAKERERRYPTGAALLAAFEQAVLAAEEGQPEVLDASGVAETRELEVPSNLSSYPGMLDPVDILEQYAAARSEAEAVESADIASPAEPDLAPAAEPDFAPPAPPDLAPQPPPVLAHQDPPVLAHQAPPDRAPQPPPVLDAIAIPPHVPDSPKRLQPWTWWLIGVFGVIVVLLVGFAVSRIMSTGSSDATSLSPQTGSVAPAVLNTPAPTEAAAPAATIAPQPLLTSAPAATPVPASTAISVTVIPTPVPTAAPIPGPRVVAALPAPRYFHSSIPLEDGRILVVGGKDSAGSILSSTLLYDPATNAWSSAGALSTPRYQHSAILLADGRVLIAGGHNTDTSFLVSAEIFDPKSRAWTVVHSMSSERAQATATRLADGSVLIIGGNNSGGYLRSVERYAPKSDTWQTVAPMANSRSGHSATLLSDNSVIVAGGFGSQSEETAERFDPAHDMWTSAGNLTTPRISHAAARLDDGRVLVMGGNNSTSRGTVLASAEWYDPAANAWFPAASMTIARTGHTATLLTDNSVLVVGGDDVASSTGATERYDPVSNTWSDAGRVARRLVRHTATRLPDGNVAILGGEAEGSPVAESADYDPPTNRWSRSS